ncbi:MAG: hypothetical protein K0R82_897 [Flavipsychrobacter sp.]|jgi:uncharacterized membrane protein YgcG|nr:hypothetical protein [Flavipsychrobacter sp.]
MEYNTTRSKMLMPEYGRNVQRMVEYLMTIEDRDRRRKNAEAIIELMGTLNPHLKTIEDYKHKLWDHLVQMTDFKLDVDAPYPAPTPEELYKKPEVLPYPKSIIKHRHMGKNLESLIQKALAETDPEKKQGFTQAIGYYMKLAYTNWHKEPVHDDMIKNELAELTNGELHYEPGGYKVYFDPRTNFKQNNNNNNNRNRNFKGGGGQGGQRSGGGGGNYSGGGSGNYNKNRKFKNKNK